MGLTNIQPQVFLEALENRLLEESVIIDVRELHEWEYYHMEEAKLIPMQQIPHRLGELPDSQPIYLVCAHGVRSYHVAEYLLDHGFDHVVNVEGGMAAIAMLRGFQYD
ncbi:rhodanese-like domain-containing protein [Paenibacillus sp. N3.4]|uniref:rhodanese-like domain-containing protein n=1 Tax=Paenibacillus sp. N3.4 TaxID=2603222 RepID=UPI0011C7C1DF|nr:rhodanese-like domain-containing protein [Paenibacillus sp. N3.4]TXK76556.1 rhodanese-like domain-containing protein [Paenibacillus sp. N3.4]